MSHCLIYFKNKIYHIKICSLILFIGTSIGYEENIFLGYFIVTSGGGNEYLGSLLQNFLNHTFHGFINSHKVNKNVVDICE